MVRRHTGHAGCNCHPSDRPPLFPCSWLVSLAGRYGDFSGALPHTVCAHRQQTVFRSNDRGKALMRGGPTWRGLEITIKPCQSHSFESTRDGRGPCELRDLRSHAGRTT
jgi:hypothetical protein